MSLILNRSFRILQECSRKLSTTTCVQGGIEKFDFQGRVLNKLLSNNLERKIRNAGARPSFKILDRKRVDALNKMYMLNISEVITLGDFPEVIDKGIQITKVSVKDTRLVEVFWIADENEDSIEIQKYLSSISGKVANKLMYATMLGHVPDIKFIHDVSAINFEETKRLLDKIAFENGLHDAKKDNTTLSEPVVNELEPPPPQMPTSVLGLPHDRIYKRIQDAKRKCYPVQIPTPPTPEEFQLQQQHSESSEKSFKKHYEQKKALRKFIKLYQKSALRSGSRLKQDSLNYNSREEFYGDVDDSNYDSFDKNWEEEDKP